MGALLVSGVVVAPVAEAVNATGARAITQACPAADTPDAGFGDVENTSFDAPVDCVAWYEVVSGVGGGRYVPGGEVRRDQMASFLVRLLTAARVDVPEVPVVAFSDVDRGSVHARAIDQLAALGVVNGDGSGRFRPGVRVARDQMAAFLNRAHEVITGAPLRSDVDYFVDDDDSVHEADINGLAEVGVVAGTGPGRYSPTVAVRRGQMAVFLARQLDLLVERNEAVRPDRAVLELSPRDELALLGAPHTVTATVTDHRGRPLEGIAVLFEIDDAPVAPVPTTDGAGRAVLTFEGDVNMRAWVDATADADGDGRFDFGPQPADRTSVRWTGPALSGDYTARSERVDASGIFGVLVDGRWSESFVRWEYSPSDTFTIEGQEATRAEFERAIIDGSEFEVAYRRGGPSDWSVPILSVPPVVPAQPGVAVP